MKYTLDLGFEIDDDRDRIDVQAVHDFLSNHAYWANGRDYSFDEVSRLVREAQRVVGLYDRTQLIGFSRTVSDGHWITYLSDLYVLPEYRGLNLGYELVQATVERGPYKDRNWLLHTRDAWGLYKKFGFEMRGEFLMERPETGINHSPVHQFPD